jgi:flagellar biosynthetic protein FliP
MMRALLLSGLLALGASAAHAMQANAAGVSPDAVLESPLQVLLLLTLLTVLPAALMCLTPFLRLSIVFHFLRQALGTQTVPSNPVLLGLSLFFSLIIMQPVFTQVYQKAWQPLEAGQMTWEQAAEAGTPPVRDFLLRFAREKDIELFLEFSGAAAPATPRDLSLTVLMPAYILSELKAAFQIGAVLFLPFLVIDIVTASVSLSVGMIQLPPVMVSAPLKILLFVVVDGWTLVVGSLLRSFAR